MHFWGAAIYFCIYTNFSEKYTSNPGTDHFLNVHLSNMFCLCLFHRTNVPQVQTSWTTPYTIRLHNLINCMRMQFLVKLHEFLHKLHAHAIFLVMQFYRVGCRSTRLTLRNVVLSNQYKQKIFKRCTLRKWLVPRLLVYFSEKLV